MVKLEAKSGWGEVETIEVGNIKRGVVGLTAEEVGLTLVQQSAESGPGANVPGCGGFRNWSRT